jgi:hypothetical protein
MARRNYGFERRRREDLQRGRQEAKRQRKADRAETGAAGPEIGEAQDTSAPAGLWEWFSASRGRAVTTAPNSRPPADEPDDWVLLTEVPPGSAADTPPGA